MLINKSNLAEAYRGLSALFNKGLLSTETLRQKISMEVPSTTDEEIHNWLSNLPGMREWLGDKQIKNVKGNRYALKNKNWEDTKGIHKNDLKDDKLGLYAPYFQAMGAAVKQHEDKTVFEALADGFATLGPDGQYFFDTDHAGPSNQSNKGTAVLAAASFNTAFTAMMDATDEDGNHLNITPNLLVVPPALRKTAKEIVKAEWLAGGATNVQAGDAEILVSSYLSSKSTTAWFLLDTTKPIKPILFQMREKAHFEWQNDGDEAFKTGIYYYGAEARYAAGYTHWQLAYGSDGTV